MEGQGKYTAHQS